MSFILVTNDDGVDTVRTEGFPADADLISVNFPAEAGVDSPPPWIRKRSFVDR